MRWRTTGIFCAVLVLIAASVSFWLRERKVASAPTRVADSSATNDQESILAERDFEEAVQALINAVSPSDDIGQGRPTNRLAALLDRDTYQIEIPAEEIQRWLAINRTNAASLLAAAQVGRDRSLYLTALTNFPNDPRVLFAVAGPNRLPEMRRELLDRFKEAAPENALADYISARDHMQNGRRDEAIADLLAASGKTSFNDYTLEDMQNREDLLMQAGKSAAEAKAAASDSTLLPHLSQMKGLAQDIAALQKEYLAAGDTASAERLAQVGLQMAEHLTSRKAGSGMITDLVGYAIERVVITPLDRQTPYDFLNGTVTERIDQLQGKRAEVKAATQLFNQWWPWATESEIVSFYDRLKLYGEVEALKWLEGRTQN